MNLGSQGCKHTFDPVENTGNAYRDSNFIQRLYGSPCQQALEITKRNLPCFHHAASLGTLNRARVSSVFVEVNATPAYLRLVCFKNRLRLTAITSVYVQPKLRLDRDYLLLNASKLLVNLGVTRGQHTFYWNRKCGEYYTLR